jgi:hypothetical protein
MIKEFTIKIPDEPGLETFDLGLTQTFSYTGPEVISALVDIGSGNLEGMNPEAYNPDFCTVIDVDAEKFPEIAYFIYNEHRELDEGELPKEQEYESIEMENGDIYQKPINLDLNDHYTIRYDHEDSCFVLEPKCMSTINVVSYSLMDKVSKFNFVIGNESTKLELGQQTAVSNEILEEIKSYIETATNYIENNPELHSWKYIDFDSLEKHYVPLSENLNDILSNYIG